MRKIRSVGAVSRLRLADSWMLLSQRATAVAPSTASPPVEATMGRLKKALPLCSFGRMLFAPGTSVMRAAVESGWWRSSAEEEEKEIC